jgi:hypothetical protein
MIEQAESQEIESWRRKWWAAESAFPNEAMKKTI